MPIRAAFPSPTTETFHLHLLVLLRTGYQWYLVTVSMGVSRVRYVLKAMSVYPPTVTSKEQVGKYVVGQASKLVPLALP